MTKHFRVTVKEKGKPDRREVRRLVNAPDLAGEELLAHVRSEWAKFYPGQTYPKIEVVGDDQPTPQPPAGALPEGMQVPK